MILKGNCMTKIIGITGLIASGKSTIGAYLRKLNFKVFDCDSIIRDLYNDDLFIKKLKNIFPLVFFNGKLNKKLLSDLIFSDINEKAKLEYLIYPVVEEKCNQFIENNKNEKIIFLDAPLLFEANLSKKCDEIILLTIDKDIQKQRYIKREGKEGIFEKIIQNQHITSDKIKKSHYIIENNFSFDKLYENIDEILKKLFFNIEK